MNHELVDFVAMLLVGVLFVGSGIFAIYIGRRMKNDQLPPNGMIGTRTLYALESEENWYRVQRASAVPNIRLGYACITAGIIIMVGTFAEHFYGKHEVSDSLVFLSVLILAIAIIWFWVRYFQVKRSFEPGQGENRR